MDFCNSPHPALGDPGRIPKSPRGTEGDRHSFRASLALSGGAIAEPGCGMASQGSLAHCGRDSYDSALGPAEGIGPHPALFVSTTSVSATGVGGKTPQSEF